MTFLKAQLPLTNSTNSARIL